jgi:hypothetical protein
MHTIIEIIKSHLILLTPFVAAAIAQIIKISIKQKGQKLNIKDFFIFTYSGMPSGHSALMVSLATITALTEGLYSALFAVTFVITVVVINDALRLRKYLGQHGEVLNVLVKELKSDDLLDRKYPHLLEKIGHTKTQVLAGCVLGFIVAVAAYVIFY